MQYALLIYEDETLHRDENGRAFPAVIAAHKAFAAELAAQGVLRGGSGLKTTDTATTVRRSAGKPQLHDGPYAETKEQLGGFYLVEAPDLDAALELARRLPLNGEGSIEVRPMIETP